MNIKEILENIPGETLEQLMDDELPPLPERVLLTDIVALTSDWYERARSLYEDCEEYEEYEEYPGYRQSILSKKVQAIPAAPALSLSIPLPAAQATKRLLDKEEKEKLFYLLKIIRHVVQYQIPDRVANKIAINPRCTKSIAKLTINFFEWSNKNLFPIDNQEIGYWKQKAESEQIWDYSFLNCVKFLYIVEYSSVNAEYEADWLIQELDHWINLDRIAIGGKEPFDQWYKNALTHRTNDQEYCKWVYASAWIIWCWTSSQSRPAFLTSEDDFVNLDRLDTVADRTFGFVATSADFEASLLQMNLLPTVDWRRGIVELSRMCTAQTDNLLLDGYFETQYEHDQARWTDTNFSSLVNISEEAKDIIECARVAIERLYAMSFAEQGVFFKQLMEELNAIGS